MLFFKNIKNVVFNVAQYSLFPMEDQNSQKFKINYFLNKFICH